MKHSGRTSRRHILRMGAAAMGGGLLAQQKILALETPGKLGTPLGPYGDRSPFEKAVRWPVSDHLGPSPSLQGTLDGRG